MKGKPAVLNSQTRLRRRPDLLASTLDGETVMLDIESGYYFGLSGVGPHIWSLLDQECSVGAIVEGVKSHFEIGAADSVEEDVTTFLQLLVDKGLVTVAA